MIEPSYYDAPLQRDETALYRDLLRECAEVLRGEIERGRWFHPGRKTCKICGTQRDLLKRIEAVT